MVVGANNPTSILAMPTLSGVAIIIGKEMEKLLYTGVYKSQCAACTVFIPEYKHACFKKTDGNRHKNGSEENKDMHNEPLHTKRRSVTVA